MDSATYWHKQDAAKPIFEALAWSRPENRAAAGKLLIIGGNLHAFAAPAQAYGEALNAGVGTARVLLPAATKKMVGPILENVEYSPSTPSGSFGRQALADFLDLGQWAEGVLIAGDTGRNSETAITVENFALKYHGQLTITKEAVEYFYHQAEAVLRRENTLLVATIAQVQKLAAAAKFPRPILFSMGPAQLADVLHDFTQSFSAHLVIKHMDTFFVAAEGQVSTTKDSKGLKTWRSATSAHAAVWWLQNPAKPFEALTTAVATQLNPQNI
jgi:NAD(P)H-hydrate repair Nnr-like enzyme with NAD(P)H-hydrate dehydratase domain